MVYPNLASFPHPPFKLLFAQTLAEPKKPNPEKKHIRTPHLTAPNPGSHPSLQSSGKTLTQVVCMCGLNHVILLLLLLQSIPFAPFPIPPPPPFIIACALVNFQDHPQTGWVYSFILLRGRRCCTDVDTVLFVFI